MLNSVCRIICLTIMFIILGEHGIKITEQPGTVCAIAACSLAYGLLCHFDKEEDK